jgi:hypothetical protein
MMMMRMMMMMMMMMFLSFFPQKLGYCRVDFIFNILKIKCFIIALHRNVVRESSLALVRSPTLRYLSRDKSIELSQVERTPTCIGADTGGWVSVNRTTTKSLKKK